MTQQVVKKLMLGVSLGASILCNPVAQAANWFQIQTISLPEWGAGKVIGFLEPLYSDYAANPVLVPGAPGSLANGQTAHFNMIQPTATSSSQLYMQRARLFIRGSVNPDISYYVGAEAGQNGYDYSFGRYAPRVIDANMVFSNYIPGVRIEVGNIRAPSAEGAMEGFMDFNFLDAFGTGLQQLMQPTFYRTGTNYKANGQGGYFVPGSDVSGNNGFRYPGLQAEDWFRISPRVEVAYGAMLADYGRLLDSGTSNGPIVAGRLQASYLLGDVSHFHGGSNALSGDDGRFFRNDLTGFVWAQAAHPDMNGTSSNMTRDGFGMTFRNGYMVKGGIDIKAEYFEGSGNIAAPSVFNESPAMASASASALQPVSNGAMGLYDETVYSGSSNTANGYDLSAGYFFNHHIEGVLRYDYYDRLPNLAAQERVFKDASVALEYHISPLTRVVVDYIDRSITIPNLNAVGNSIAQAQAEAIVNSIGNQMDVWLVYAF